MIDHSPPPTEQPQTDRMLSRREAAAYIGVSHFTMSGWASRDKRAGRPPRIRFTRIGVRVLYLQSDLDEVRRKGVPSDAALGAEEKKSRWACGSSL